MTLRAAIKETFASRNFTDLFDFLDAVKEKIKIKQGDDAIFTDIDEYILESGVTDIFIHYEADKIVYREELFTQTSFKIQLTPDELANKQLVFGHRFLPFIHPSTHPEKIFLIDETDTEIKLVSEQQNLQDYFIYLSLLPPYGLQHYDVQEGGVISLYIYDLKDWLAQNKFTSKDVLLISPIDYKKNIFRLEKLSGKELNRQKIVDNRKDELLTESLLDELLENEVILPIDVQLFHAFAACDPIVLEQAGSAIGPFVSTHEVLEIFNNGSYSYLNTQANLDDTFGTVMDEAMNPDLDAMGTATDIKGIFSEMGISFTEEFVIAKMIDQLQNQQKIDADEIYRILLKRGTASFYNKAQHDNFDQAFAALAAKTTKQWKGIKSSLPERQLLKHTLNFKMAIIGLLRDIDAKLTDPSNFDFSLLMQIQPFEHITDGLLDLLIDPEQARAPNLVNDLNKKIKLMQGEFNQAKVFILDQIS